MSIQLLTRLHKHYQTMRPFDMRHAIKESSRNAQFSLRACGLLLDYSKNLITRETVQLLCQLAKERHAVARLERQMQGEKVNHTEKRAALHTAMRDLTSRSPMAAEIARAAKMMRARIYRLRKELISQTRRGFSAKPIRSIVNLGIGGSYLGPLTVCTALPPAPHAPHCDFLASSSPDAIAAILQRHKLETTLFIISSKSFTSEETMHNAHFFLDLYLKSIKKEQALQHFYAVTAAPEKAQAFGLDAAHIFTLPESIGGRFSLWSAIGLPIIMQIGEIAFEQFLAGAFDMDTHSIRKTGDQNMPLVLALLSYWYIRYWKSPTSCINVYEHGLRRLPEFLQQLSMESCGKRIGDDNQPADCSGEILWGGEGTGIQHSYMQLCHQGPHLIPMDIIFGARPQHSITRTAAEKKAHQALQANALAQSQALSEGRNEREAARLVQEKGLSAEQAAHLVMPGNRPSNCLIYEELSPYSLGALLSLYEHKTVLFAYLAGINPFDQWGVELGKQLSARIQERLAEKESNQSDGVMASLIKRIRELN